jgi:hypothetical protein
VNNNKNYNKQAINQNKIKYVKTIAASPLNKDAFFVTMRTI